MVARRATSLELLVAIYTTVKYMPSYQEKVGSNDEQLVVFLDKLILVNKVVNTFCTVITLSGDLHYLPI